MLTNEQKKLNLFIFFVAVTVIASAGMATAEVSYHLVRFPDTDSPGAIAITDSGFILADNWVDGMHVSMLLEPARDAAGNPIWDSDGDGIADSYTVITLNPGVYQHTVVRSINESLDVVGRGTDQDGNSVALLWLNAPAGNPPVELGRTFDADYVYALSINELGQVIVYEYASDFSDPDFYNWWNIWVLSLINPKDIDGDGLPDLWNEDLDGDGNNDLMVNVAVRELGFGGCSNCSVGTINNYGEVAGMLSDSNKNGFVIIPEDTDGDSEPDLWFKDLDGDGRNDLAKDLGPNINTLTLSDSGAVVGTKINSGKINDYFYRWQINESGNVDLVAEESGACYMRGVNDMGQAVGNTRKYLGQYKIKFTTYLWEPDLTIINLLRVLDNPTNTAQSLRCSDISNTGCIVGTVYDNYPEDTDAFVAVPITDSIPPEVSIITPADGAIFDSGVTINFSGTAHDAEDGDLTDYLVWTSSVDGQIGSSDSFSTTLSDGIHSITASVTDSGGKTGSDSISIRVGTVSPEVIVDSITPNSAQAGTSIGVTIDGSGFVSGADVTFEDGRGPTPSTDVTYVDSTTIEAMVTVHKKAKPGVQWDVRVANPDGSSDVLVDGFTVIP